MSYLEEILEKERKGLKSKVETPSSVTDIYYRKIILTGQGASPNDWYPLSKHEYTQYELRTKGDKK